MKLGLFMMPLHTMKLGYKEMFDQDLEAALYADQLGFDEFWLGEHVSAKVEPIPNALQFMSALIPQTKNLVFGSGVLNLPNHHPARVAADVALFDHMSNGRYLMGIGPGGLASDMELFGSAGKNLGEMMLESLAMIEEIWSTDPPYDIEGKYWTIRDPGFRRARSRDRPDAEALSEPVSAGVHFGGQSAFGAGRPRRCRAAGA